MRLEYFDDAFDGSGLLLFYSGTLPEVVSLRATLTRLFVLGVSIPLHDLEFIDTVDNCRVTASALATGGRVLALSDPPNFRWGLSPSDWQQAHGLLEPFCEPLPSVAGTHFQYLHEYGGIEVIYSTTRGW